MKENSDSSKTNRQTKLSTFRLQVVWLLYDYHFGNLKREHLYWYQSEIGYIFKIMWIYGWSCKKQYSTLPEKQYLLVKVTNSILQQKNLCLFCIFKISWSYQYEDK